jgi:hypothetical protein
LTAAARHRWHDDHSNHEVQRVRAPLRGTHLVAWSIQPLGIRIVGDVAIMHYYDMAGKDNGVRSSWTDVLVKQGNRWRWIADHGGVDPASRAESIR